MGRVNIALHQGPGQPAYALQTAPAPAGVSAILRARVTTSDNPVPTTYFYPETYNANAGDGVTDARAAIQSAYNAARAYVAAGGHATVRFTAGRTYVCSSWVLLNTIRTNDWVGATNPTVQQAGVVAFAGDATIRLTGTRTGFLRAAYSGVWTTPQYATYGNLVIDGLTIDNNNRVTGTMTPCICMINGYGNADNITVKNVTMPYGKVAYRTGSANTNGANGFVINLNAESRTQTHWAYVTNITLEDCTIYSQGKPIGIYSNTNCGQTTFGTNPILYDNINVARCYCNSSHYYTSNIHIGSFGAGYRCSVTDCTCEDSTDDGLEINAFNEVTVTGCTFSKCRQPICFTWFCYPYKTDIPTYTITDCDYVGDCEPYWLDGVSPEPGARAPMMPEFRGATNTEGSFTQIDDRHWGNVVISGCTCDIGSPAYDGYTDYRSFFSIGSNGLPLYSVSITDCDITDRQATASTDFITITQGSQMSRTLPITINDVRWRNSTGDAYALLTSGQVALSGARTVTTDISGLT